MGVEAGRVAADDLLDVGILGIEVGARGAEEVDCLVDDICREEVGAVVPRLLAVDLRDHVGEPAGVFLGERVAVP